MGWIARRLARVWKKSRFDLTFAAFAFVWLVGVTITTSYLQLLPLWVALGWLSIWPRVCKSPEHRRAVISRDGWDDQVAPIEPRRWTADQAAAARPIPSDLSANPIRAAVEGGGA